MSIPARAAASRTGGDFRCFHLDVAGFYRLLEMMVAFGRVVDQVAEFEASSSFQFFPSLLIRMIPATVPITALFLRGEGKAAYRLLGCRGRWRGIARVLSAIFHPFLTSPEPFLQDSSLFSVQDGLPLSVRCFPSGKVLYIR